MIPFILKITKKNDSCQKVTSYDIESYFTNIPLRKTPKLVLRKNLNIGLIKYLSWKILESFSSILLWLTLLPSLAKFKVLIS